MRLPITLPIQRSHPLARLLNRGEVAALTLCADGRLGLEYRDGRRAEAEVAPDTTVFTALVVLRYRVAGHRGSLVLPRPALGADAHRRLRVWLRCGMSSAAGNHEPA